MTTASRPPVPAAWGDFLTLPENRSVVRAARGLARALLAGKRPPVTPLVLHGSPGTGKTHLTATLLKRLSRGAAVLTAQTVSVGDLARVAVNATTPGFDDPDLLACDLLVLEDVQLLPARATDPVCDLLDRRVSRRKAVVVTANAGPAGLGHLPRKLTSRLASGLVLQLESLAPTSRRVVLEATAAARGVRLTADALDWLAGQATGGGVRSLLGLLGNLAQGEIKPHCRLHFIALERWQERPGSLTRSRQVREEPPAGDRRHLPVNGDGPAGGVRIAESSCLPSQQARGIAPRWLHAVEWTIEVGY